MLPPEIAAWAYHQEEMAKIMGITVDTLKGRISRGTNHPPCQQWMPGIWIFPKAEFGVWGRTKSKLIYEVRSA